MDDHWLFVGVVVKDNDLQKTTSSIGPDDQRAPRRRRSTEPDCGQRGSCLHRRSRACERCPRSPHDKVTLSARRVKVALSRQAAASLHNRAHAALLAVENRGIATATDRRDTASHKNPVPSAPLAPLHSADSVGWARE